MYIPTQKERYSKTAQITLLLCVMIPSGIVVWLSGEQNLLTCCTGFLWALGQLFIYMGFTATAALCISAFVQAVVFFGVVRSRKLTPRGKLTIAVTWGMLFAFILRLLLAFELWRNITGR